MHCTPVPSVMFASLLGLTSAAIYASRAFSAQVCKAGGGGNMHRTVLQMCFGAQSKWGGGAAERKERKGELCASFLICI